VEFQRRPRSRKRRITVFLAVVMAATVGLGVSIASAHGGGGRNGGWGWRHHPRPISSAPTSPSSSAPSSGPTDSTSASDPGSPSDSSSSSSNPPDNGGGTGGTADPNDPDGDGPLTAADYADIRTASRIAAGPRTSRNGSRGTFISSCGRPLANHHNSDNYIVAPGVNNGAHHIHDYVGNVSTDANSTDQSLAAAGTTCNNGDKSPYVWPALRDITKQGNDADKLGGGLDGNFGKLLVPVGVQLQFRGNPQAKVVAMPQFLRAITGDAKAAVVNAPSKNARAQWSCSNVPGRAFTDKFPLCPAGGMVVRTENLPSCWDGVNLDAANHRDHLVFPDATTGACPANTKAVPQLHVTLTYRVPAGRSFALDTFPSELRKPITDHFDFENVMSAGLMRRVVSCINAGANC
jgi:Domain of unknown function (DUF1996)